MLAFAAWEFLWGFGMPFSMFVTITPAYLGVLHAPKWLIGLVLASPAVFAAGQIVLSHRVSAFQRLKAFRWLTIGSLIPLFAYSLLACLWGDAWPLVIHWICFATAQVVFTGISTLAVSIYWEMMTDNIPPRRRGLLFGLRMASVGGTGLAMGYLALRVLTKWSTPLNFRISLLIGTLFFMLSCVALWLVRDHVNPEHSPDFIQEKMSFFSYVKETMHKMWQRANYRMAMLFLVMLAVASNGAPFMVAAARDQLHVTASAQGMFSLVYLGATAGLGWIIGLLADRYGYRTVAWVCSTLIAMAFLFCLTIPHVTFWYVAYGAYSIVSMTVGMILCNLSAELCPDIAPNRLMAVGNILVMACVLPITTLNGAIVDWTGSYHPVFIVNLTLSLLAITGFVFFVHEPRQTRQLN